MESKSVVKSQINPTPSQKGLLNAYTDVFTNSLSVMEGTMNAVDLVNWHSVSEFSARIGMESFYKPILEEAEQLDCTTVIDLGCGASYLSQKIIQNYGYALGIDQTDEAISQAKENAIIAGVEGRYSAVKMDIVDLLIKENQSIIKGGTIFLANFIFHDILSKRNKETLIKILELIFKNMAANGRLFVSEATRSAADSDHSVFSKIFTALHYIQGIELPTDKEWQMIFGTAGFTIDKVVQGVMEEGANLYILKKTEPTGVGTQSVPTLVEMDGHKAKVPLYYMSEIMDIAAVDLGALEGTGPAAPHRHDTTELYLLPNYPERVEVKVTVNGVTETFSSPLLLEIPAGAVHSFQPVKAKNGQFIFGLFPKNREEDIK